MNEPAPRSLPVGERRDADPMLSPRIYFEMSDLVNYLGSHANLTGIQRVQASIVLALAEAATGEQIRFLTFSDKAGDFLEIDAEYLLALLADLARPAGDRTVAFDKSDARDGHLPNSRPFRPETGVPACLCLLGAAWNIPDYFLKIRNLKSRYGIRFVALLHDLIPIFARETCDAATADNFAHWLDGSVRYVDQYLCVSESTKRDLIRHLDAIGETTPEPIVTRNGGQLPPVDLSADVSAIDPQLRDGNYVLFVSTVEGRKNHIGAFRAMQQLAQEGVALPYLVCVGRLGWRAEPFLVACEASDYLDGHIKILSGLSDAELATLYRHCLFSIYPSVYEGWGLPVGEAMAFGKVCITSSTTAMPEVGGEYALYADPGKPRELAREMARLITDPAELARREEAIRTRYRPVEWAEVAGQTLAACRAALSRPVRPSAARLRIGREYPLTLPTALPLGLTGPQMIDAVRMRRGRQLTPGVYGDDDYDVGQSFRTGEGWFPPGYEVSWTRAEGGGLTFEVENVSAPLVAYLGYELQREHLGGYLLASAGAGSPEKIALKATSGTLAIPLRNLTGNADTLTVSLDLSVRDGSGAASPDRTKARQAIGITSLLVLREDDTAARLTVMEGSLHGRSNRVQGLAASAGHGAGEADTGGGSAVAWRFLFAGQQPAARSGLLQKLRRSYLLGQARKAARARRWRHAEQAYRDLLAADPTQARVWIQYGHTVKEQGDPEGALGAYQMAARLDPTSKEALMQVGHALVAAQRPLAAEAAFRDAERLTASGTRSERDR